jgi:hypothetical protein
MAAAAAQQMAPAEASPAALNAYGAAFRDYTLLETPRQRAVAVFYAEQHAQQTYAFVQAQKAKHLGLQRREMSIWEAAGAQAARVRGRCRPSRHIMLCCATGTDARGRVAAARRRSVELLNEVVDDSDPDLDLPQVWARC